MNASELHSVIDRKKAGRATEGQFEIVLLYDGETALKAARHIIETVVGKHFDEADVHRDELSFAEVMHPELRTESIQMASGCDVFVTATANGSHLPAAVASWITLWLESRPQKETALISIAGSPPGSVASTAMQDYLHHLADRQGLSFFSSNYTLPAAELKEPEKFARLEAGHRVPHDIKPRPERWGLNE